MKLLNIYLLTLLAIIHLSTRVDTKGKLDMPSEGCPTDQKYSSYSIDESVKNPKTIINASSTDPYTQLC